MKRFFGLVFGAFFWCILFGCVTTSQPTVKTAKDQQVDKIIISSGKNVMGAVYYATGKNICGIINSDSKYGIICKSISSEGSIDNINKVLTGKVQFGIAQEDYQSDAWKGLGKWSSKGPQQKLRSVFGLHDEPQFGVKATMITSIDVPDNLVYVLTKSMFENFEKFKNLHEAYQTITKKNMLEGLTAPIHPGALKYYEEIGIYK